MAISDNCSGCKRVKEHVSSLLPFKIIESATGKPLRIGGIAMVAGMSRNLNVYTSDELAVFAEKLVDAPVYIEHVDVGCAAGKVTQCNYDSASRCLRYEAEIYDQSIAEKIRNGLIRHVSVGADYEAIDVVDAKVPHGLFNPELSLVAVPGMHETNIHVLEHVDGDKSDGLLEKDLVFIAQQVASKVNEKNGILVENLRAELLEVKTKLLAAEQDLKNCQVNLDESKSQLDLANKTIEDLQKQTPVGLFKNLPKMMAISEHITVLERLVPPLVVERSSMSMQRQAQIVRAAVFEAKKRLAGGS